MHVRKETTPTQHDARAIETEMIVSTHTNNKRGPGVERRIYIARPFPLVLTEDGAPQACEDPEDDIESWDVRTRS